MVVYSIYSNSMAGLGTGEVKEVWVYNIATAVYDSKSNTS